MNRLPADHRRTEPPGSAWLPSPHFCGGRICRLIFFVKVWVLLPWVASYSTISRINRALASSDKPDAFTSFASVMASNVEGQFDFASAAAFSAVR